MDDRLRLREVRVWEAFDMTEPIWQCVEHPSAESPIVTLSTYYNTLMLSLAFPLFYSLIRQNCFTDHSLLLKMFP